MLESIHPSLQLSVNIRFSPSPSSPSPTRNNQMSNVGTSVVKPCVA